MVIDRIVNAVRRRRPRPSIGQIVRPEARDAWKSYPADGLTPQRLLAILRAADDGDLEEQMSLYEQMEEKDAHLFSVAQTRRLAVTGLEWRIVPASAVDPERCPDIRLAAQTADYCRRALAEIEDFDAALAHLSLGVGRNVAVAELIWSATGDGLRLERIAAVAFTRLRTGKTGELRVLTREASTEGVELPPDKFIVHRPHGAGHTARGGLLRVTAMAFLAKHYAMKDWLIYMEVFGMPVRIARYAPDASPEEKRELLDMLRRLGTDAAGVFSKSVDLEIKQTRVPGDTAPYESICHFFNREMSKAWLGQTLTTDTARSLASVRAAEVHDRVRRDIRDHDIKQEALTIRRDLLAPLVQMRFGPGAPVPFFRRLVEHPRDPESLGQILSLAVNQLGFRVPAAWAHEALGLPQAREGEAALGGREARNPKLEIRNNVRIPKDLMTETAG